MTIILQNCLLNSLLICRLWFTKTIDVTIIFYLYSVMPYFRFQRSVWIKCCSIIFTWMFTYQKLTLVAQLDARLTGDQEVAGLIPAEVANILSWRFDHKILSRGILSLPLIQEGQLSVSGKRMCTVLVTRPASVAQLDAPSNWRPGGRGFNPRWGWQHAFVEIDHEILSTVILSLLLIQEGQLSVSGERMCTILVNRLED